MLQDRTYSYVIHVCMALWWCFWQAIVLCVFVVSGSEQCIVCPVQHPTNQSHTALQLTEKQHPSCGSEQKHTSAHADCGHCIVPTNTAMTDFAGLVPDLAAVQPEKEHSTKPQTLV